MPGFCWHSSGTFFLPITIAYIQMLNFIKHVASVIVALLIFFGGVIFFGFITLVLLSPSDEVVVKEQSVLYLNLNNQTLVERASKDDFNLNLPIPLIGGSAGESTVGIDDLKQALRSAAGSDKIAGVYLKAGTLGGGRALFQELRNELETFKESGKFLISYSPYYSESGYYLASVADEVFLHPTGGMDFSGLSSQGVYLRGLFDKIGLEPEVLVVGEYKSAVETFTRRSRSEADREQTLDFLTDLHEININAVAESRDLSVERVMEINNNLLVRNTEDAVELGLADGVHYEDEVRNHILQQMELNPDEAELELISAGELNKSGEAVSPEGDRNSRVAVIYASGDIGSDASAGIYDKRMVEEIRKARENEDVKAMVLRVDSPGGGVLASDEIRRELELTQQEMPLIASMGNVAASGGYWISMPADTVMAQSNTITGSIGIFGLLFNVEEMLNDKLGIQTDMVKTGRFSDLGNPARPKTQEERAILQQNIEEGYDLFIEVVAEGRDMEEAAVREVAEGRVYSGQRALELNLVDLLGGLDDAVALAAEMAGIQESYRTIAYPQQKSFFENLMQDLGGAQAREQRLRAELGPLYPAYKQLRPLLQHDGVVARMPYDIVIE